MPDYCIVIPVYKKELDCIEEISLKRLHKLVYDPPFHMDEYRDWNETPVYLVYPEGLDITNYKKIYPTLLEKTFDPKYFTSTAAYSQLCISYDFYKSFADDHDYMLIYQLDCYLFENKIGEWCKKGYDYIGGPIVSTDCGWDTVKESKKGKKWTPYVGNGGLSLRKISTFLEITDPNGELRKTYGLTDEKLKNVRFEDKYFCNDLYNLYELEVPSWDEALYFAIDMSVDVIYNYFKWTGKPMGAHSIDKNIRWWKNVIPELKDQKVIDYCEKKNAEFFKLYYDENDSTLRTN